MHEIDAVLNSQTLKIMKAQTPAIKKPTDLSGYNYVFEVIYNTKPILLGNEK